MFVLRRKSKILISVLRLLEIQQHSRDSSPLSLRFCYSVGNGQATPQGKGWWELDKQEGRARGRNEVSSTRHTRKLVPTLVRAIHRIAKMFSFSLQ